MERASSEYGNHSLRPSDLAFVAAAGILGMGAYLIAAAGIYRLGFPLDDSWIHATYARNLASLGQWEFQVGHPSAGSTAPLWTLLLVPGYWFGLAPLWWSHILGLLTLTGLGLTSEAAMRRLVPSYRPRAPWVGIFVASEWHMLWAAASGMETLLHAAISTALIFILATGSRPYAALGLLTGLSTWVRPDGLLLAGPVFFVLVFSHEEAISRLRAALSFLIGAGALLIPYLAFNLWLSGTPMPNTFYAKQAEYAAWQARPILGRIGLGLVQLSTGPFVLLWPGLAATVIRATRTRNTALIASLFWSAGYLCLYVIRLPVYQHARYLMPAMPTLFLLGILGYLELGASNWLTKRGPSLARAWISGLALLSIGFVFLGARSYGTDVAVIESEMVNTAFWVTREVPPGIVIAAHDIGALGYFDRHPLIDMAGLVSPEVVPFIRDEERLALLLDRRGVRYLIAFPNLYPELAKQSVPVHTSGGEFAPAAGQGNMTVFCWRCP